MPLLVGVSGGSGSGKTTLAHHLVATFPGSARWVSFDNYYRDQSHLTMAERHGVNYDHPDSLDVEQFAKDLAVMASGQPVEIPVYDFTTHSRSDETLLIEPLDLIVVDGILLLVYPEIRDLLDLRIFVDASDELRTERRVARDIAERGRTRELSLNQIAATVRPMYEEFVAPSRQHADLTIDGTAAVEESGAKVMALLHDVLSSRKL